MFYKNLLVIFSHLLLLSNNKIIYLVQEPFFNSFHSKAKKDINFLIKELETLDIKKIYYSNSKTAYFFLSNLNKNRYKFQETSELHTTNENINNNIFSYSDIKKNRFFSQTQTAYSFFNNIELILEKIWEESYENILIITDKININFISLYISQASINKYGILPMNSYALSKIKMNKKNDFTILFWNDNHFHEKTKSNVYDVFSLHFLDQCNFRCIYCYVDKQLRGLSLEQIKTIIDKVSDYFSYYQIKGRINIAGGEPLVSNNINAIIDYIYNKGIEISIITNGYYLTKEFIDINKKKLKMIGVSIDSLNEETNKKIKRCTTEGELLNIEKIIKLCEYIKQNNIKLKINTCLSKLNINEDFNPFLEKVKPDRYKVLQMLCEDDDKINVPNRTTDEELEYFVNKHKKFNPVKETQESLIKSYIIIDSEGNLFTNNLHKSKRDLLKGDIFEIFNSLDIDDKGYRERYKN